MAGLAERVDELRRLVKTGPDPRVRPAGARRRGPVPLDRRAPGASPAGSSPQAQARSVAVAAHALGARSRRVA
jgi:hypothetical protein